MNTMLIIVLQEVAKFINEDPNLVNARDENGMTPLHVACKGNDSIERSNRIQHLKLEYQNCV